MTGQKTKTARPVVNTMDLTLEQLDEAAQLVNEGQCGYMASVAYVGLKHLHRKAISVEDAKGLTLRDVEIIDNGELDQVEGTSSDPTT